MVYTPHSPIKVEKLLPAYAAVLGDNLVLAKLVQHQSIDQFKGAANDTISMRVAGRLPAREYAFRNDRTNGIVFDVYSENKITLTANGHLYSAVQITDEQIDFDFLSPASLVPIQGRAVATDLNHLVADKLESAPFEATIGGARYNLRRALVELRRVLNAFRVPAEQRILVVGSNFESELLSDDKLTLAQNVGDATASAALHAATLGSLLGFVVVRDDTIDPDTAYGLIPSAVALATGVPPVSSSVPFGSTISYDGFALRWQRDYDLDHMVDRSVLDTWYGINYVKDMLGYWDSASDPKQEKVDTTQYFLRGAKLTLDGSSAGPVENGKTALAAETNVGALWEGTAPAAG